MKNIIIDYEIKNYFLNEMQNKFLEDLKTLPIFKLDAKAWVDSVADYVKNNPTCEFITLDSYPQGLEK